MWYGFAGPPSYPEKFHYTERTKDSVTLTWKPPRNDGGSPVIGYFVEKKRQDQQNFEPCNTEICPDMSMVVQGLEDDWMYEFRIKCTNLIGESEPSIPLSVLIKDDEGAGKMFHFKWAFRLNLTLNLKVFYQSFSGNMKLKNNLCSVPFSGSRSPYANKIQGRFRYCEEG